MRIARLGVALLSCVAFSFGVGCAAENEEAPAASGEAALVETRTLVEGIEHPSGLAVANGYLYYGQNEFVASGDPELDQEFAYWTGIFSRVPVGGGRAKKIADDGPITKVRVSGTKVYYAMASGCWISQLDARTTSSGSSVYHKDNCEPDWGAIPAGFEIAGGKLIVVDSSGDVVAGALDGSGMQKIGQVRLGDRGDVVDSHALADGKVFLITQSDGTAKPQSLYSLPVSGGRATKVLDFPSKPQNLTSDGKNLYFSADGTKVFTLRAGKRQPELVAEGFGTVGRLAADASNVYVADTKRDAIYMVRDAATSPKRAEKLAEASGLDEIIVDQGVVYFGTHLDGRRNGGRIGSLQVPR